MPDQFADRLRRVVAGDRAAQAWLYDNTAPRLYRRLRLRYENAYDLDAEELLQDSFVYFLKDHARVVSRFLERFPAGDQEELDRYLWDLACGLASNRMRNRKTRRAAMKAVREVESFDDPETRRIDRDTVRRLEECLRGKRERVFLYYKLRFVDGFSPSEIAQATGWSKRTTYRVRQHLNDAIQDCIQGLELDGV